MWFRVPSSEPKKAPRGATRSVVAIGVSKVTNLAFITSL